MQADQRVDAAKHGSERAAEHCRMGFHLPFAQIRTGTYAGPMPKSLILVFPDAAP